MCVTLFHLQYIFVSILCLLITDLLFNNLTPILFFSRYHYSYKIGYIPEVRYQNYFKPLRTVDSVVLTPRDGKRGLTNKMSAPFYIS